MSSIEKFKRTVSASEGRNSDNGGVDTDHDDLSHNSL